MEINTIRDVTHQMFPVQSPILIRNAGVACRIIVDYKDELFLGIFDERGISLEDMFPIQTIYRLVEGGVAILFENRDGALFIHILQLDPKGTIECVNIRGSVPVSSTEEFILSKNEQYNKLAHLFRSPKKVERAPSFI